jgi:hypothetical protein
MKEKKRHILFLTMFTVFLTTVLVLPPPVSAGPLEPPDNAVDINGNPVPTMLTLSEIYFAISGEVTCLDVPQSVRFVINGDGTVTDCDNGIMWDQNANRFGQMNWYTAIGECDNLELGGHNDWRLSSLEELMSIVDTRFSTYCISNTEGDDQWEEGDPFLGVIAAPYWTSTVHTDDDFFAYLVTFGPWTSSTGYEFPCGANFTVNKENLDLTFGAWCVREP